PMFLPQLVDGLRPDRERAGDEVIQKDAETVDVGGLAGGRAIEEFRRDVERRPREIRQPAPPAGVDLAAGAEVHQDDAAAVFTADISGLHVALEEPRRMECRQGTTQV